MLIGGPWETWGFELTSTVAPLKQPVIIGTRGSKLALWQARYAQQKLEAAGCHTELKVIRTQGDKQQDKLFSDMHGVGFFTKELEVALLNKEVDLAVHSYKDLATHSPPGLLIAAVSEREDPADCLLIHKDATDKTKPLRILHAGTVGTSSPRRQSQLLAHRPDLKIKPLRGSVQTRMRKLQEGQYDAIVMAKAAIVRAEMDMKGVIVHNLSPQTMIPAPAQGVLAYQIREEDKALQKLLDKINTPGVKKTTDVEREALARFEAGCQQPVGVHCTEAHGMYYAWTSKAEKADEVPIRIFVKATSTQALAQRLVKLVRQVHPIPIFITRDLNPGSFLKHTLEARGFQVTGQSLLDFRAIPFKAIPKTDWLFFTSPRCVTFFFAQSPKLPEGVKIGVMGSGTANALRRTGYEPAFTGKGVDSRAIAAAFAEKADGQDVVFPVNKHSLRKIQGHLTNTIRQTDLTVYESLPRQSIPELHDARILVFTSPMNVRAYLQQRHLPKGSRIISVGPTTGKALEQAGIDNYTIPYAPDEVNLTDTIMTAAGGIKH